jgi:hypothetical protein
MLVVHLADVVWDLLCYGEDAVAERAKSFTVEEQATVWRLAHLNSLMDDGKRSGAGMMIAKAIALAAIEVAEGAPRSLTLKRRRTPDERPPMPPESMAEVFKVAKAREEARRSALRGSGSRDIRER